MVTVNYKTEHLLRAAVESFRAFYPAVPMVVLDNGSADGSTEYVSRIGVTDKLATVVLNEENQGHGPALHHCIANLVQTPYVLTFDSDCKVVRGGFIEQMLSAFQADEKLYAIGWLRYVNVDGVAFEWHVPPPETKAQFCPYVHPSCGLYARDKYMALRNGFIDHGAPAVNNMRDAMAAGYHLQDFPVAAFVEHWVAGTRRMFGGHWHPSGGAKPQPWNARQTFPI